MRLTRKSRGASWIIFLLAGALVLVIGALTIPFILIGAFRFGDLAKATGQSPVTVSSECITPLLPTITDPTGFAAAIDTYIKKTAAASPFVGMGADFVAAGQANGINPAWEVNIARKEEVLGTANATPVTQANNSFGLTATASQPHISSNGRLWYKFDSFKASIPIEAAYLQRRYISQGLTTFETIIPVYAPPSENNTAQYIADMKDWVGQVMTAAGASVTCNAGASNPSIPITPF